MFLRVGGIFDLGAAAGNELVVVAIDMVRNFFAIEGVSVIEVQVQGRVRRRKDRPGIRPAV